MTERDIPKLTSIEDQLAARLAAEKEFNRLWDRQVAFNESVDARLLALESAGRPPIPIPPIDPPDPPVVTPPIVVTDPTVPQPPANALNTKDFPGDDVGAKVNAALASNPTKAVIVQPGTIATQIQLLSNRVLYFQPGEFPIVNPAPTSKDPQGARFWFGAILQGHHSRIWGAGEDKTKFIEPAKYGYIVIQASEDAVMDTGNVFNSKVTNDIGGGFFSVLGANTQPEGGVHSTIQPGNAHGVDYQHISLIDTSCLGITAGGTAINGNHAEDVLIAFIRGEGLASQTVNLVNGQRVKFRHIVCLRPGKFLEHMNLTSIDLEPNTNLDIIRDVQIIDVVVDATNSPLVNGQPISTGNGIAIQNTTFTKDYGPVLLEKFTIFGGPLIQDYAGRLSTGVYVGGPTIGVTVRNGYVQRVGQSLYRFEDGMQSVGENLEGVSGGTGGNEAFDVHNTTHSRFTKIKMSIDPNSLTASKRIIERGTSAFNTFKDCDPAATLIPGNGSTSN